MVALGVVFPVYTNKNGGAKWHGRKDQGEHEGTGERENPGEKRRERKPGKEFCFVLMVLFTGNFALASVFVFTR